jgi:RNA polymerase sigma factor (TIGR02999 family)
VEWRDRAHFFGVASTLMRRVLVDYARKHATAKRGGERARVPLANTQLSVEAEADRLVALDDALTRLAALDQRLCRVVECRFFAGLTGEETAEALGVTTRTVERDWVKAKALLYMDLAV